VKPILNLQEARVDRLLDDYARTNGYRVLLKTRLRDVIDVDNGGATARERDFAFKAHLDFVVADEKTHLPVLVVEYDGSQHWSDPKQRARDEIKERLCRAAGLEFLRIDSLYSRTEGRWQVLGYILEMHEAGKSFAAAQAQGYIPEDELFIHNLLIDTSDPLRPTFTGLDSVALQELQRMLVSGAIKWYAQWWRSVQGRTEAQCVLELTNGQFLSSNCALQQFTIEGISALEVAEEIAMAELGWLAQRYEAGEPVALSAAQGRLLLDDLRGQQPHHNTPNSWSLHASAGSCPVR
jgi:hypothetical protein